MKDLYLCENLPVESPFQIVFHDKNNDITWSVLPKRGMARIYSKFHLGWERRTINSFGGDYKVLDGILTSIPSWSTALATIGDFLDLVRSF